MEPGRDSHGWHQFELTVPRLEGITIGADMCRIITVGYYVKVSIITVGYYVKVGIITVGYYVKVSIITVGYKVGILAVFWSF